jgi:hypothetical protein
MGAQLGVPRNAQAIETPKPAVWRLENPPPDRVGKPFALGQGKSQIRPRTTEQSYLRAGDFQGSE